MAMLNMPAWLAIALFIGAIFYAWKGKPAFGLKKNYIAVILAILGIAGGAIGAIQTYAGGTSFLSASGVPSITTTGASCPDVAVTAYTSVKTLASSSELFSLPVAFL